MRSSDGLRLVRKTAICGGAKDQSEDGGSNKAAESINIILLFIVCRMKVTVKDSSETGCVNCVVIRKRERETDRHGEEETSGDLLQHHPEKHSHSEMFEIRRKRLHEVFH